MPILDEWGHRDHIIVKKVFDLTSHLKKRLSMKLKMLGYKNEY